MLARRLHAIMILQLLSAPRPLEVRKSCTKRLSGPGKAANLGQIHPEKLQKLVKSILKNCKQQVKDGA
ncbi:hypothetical protein DXC52_08950 [Collinsella sp. TF05-9AC]|nr:hypothetical protein DXC52_08950 [Collinsella sp. TF05-9AC]